MSLAATLRPSGLNFTSPLSSVYGFAADDASGLPFRHDSNYLALNRMLIRYQNLILLIPSPLTIDGISLEANNRSQHELSPLQRQIQAELYSPLPYHRTKWLHNIQGARNILLQLERQAQGIKVQRTKREALKDLSDKRSTIKRLRLRVEEIAREVEGMGAAAWDQAHRGHDVELLGDKVEDILGDVLDERPKKPRRGDDLLLEGKTVNKMLSSGQGNDDNEDVYEEHDPAQKSRERDEVFQSSSIRQRHGLNPPNTSSATANNNNHNNNTTKTNKSRSDPDKEKDKGLTSGFSNLSTTEKSLDSSTQTHEILTTSLINMATQLKQQTRAFEFALNQDKNLLDRALDGLDRNVSAMDLASRNMAFLKRMSEGEGWWGRMKLYAIIVGMWVFAVLLVFVGPKLRF